MTIVIHFALSGVVAETRLGHIYAFITRCDAVSPHDSFNGYEHNTTCPRCVHAKPDGPHYVHMGKDGVPFASSGRAL
jgi:hypothetical protein